MDPLTYPPRSEQRLHSFFRRKATLEWLAKEASKDPVTGSYGNIIYAFGAAKFKHNSRGSAASPVWAFRAALAEKCKAMVLVNEYMTSQLCYKCKSTVLKGTRVRGERRELHGVRECRLCRMRINRDVNSALNMLFLFFFQLSQEGNRPPGFAPGNRRNIKPIRRRTPPQGSTGTADGSAAGAGAAADAGADAAGGRDGAGSVDGQGVGSAAAGEAGAAAGAAAKKRSRKRKTQAKDTAARKRPRKRAGKGKKRAKDSDSESDSSEAGELSPPPPQDLVRLTGAVNLRTPTGSQTASALHHLSRSRCPIPGRAVPTRPNHC